jgi:lipoprotein-anchoring transpeptidase ErfK/SrfK
MNEQFPRSGRFPGRAGGPAGGRARAVLGLVTGRRPRAVAAALAVAGAALLAFGLGGCTQEPSGNYVPVVAPVQVSAAEFAKLTRATTFTSIPAAARDQDPFAVTDGVVMHPLTAQVVYLGPGEKPVAVLPDTELGGPTWVPVVASSPGWIQVLLPNRPDRSTGWIYDNGTSSTELVIRVTPYLIHIEVGARKLTIYDSGVSLGTWTVAVGAPGTPTPTGRTFILALLAPPHPTYSPLIMPLGTHSNALSSFGGGPGTVGLHGWPDPAVFGNAVSNGCVRVPATALRILSKIPLGTLVLITA